MLHEQGRPRLHEVTYCEENIIVLRILLCSTLPTDIHSATAASAGTHQPVQFKSCSALESWNPGPHAHVACTEKLCTFMTMVLPAASAGPSFQACIRSGKFQGIIWPTTPGSITLSRYTDVSSSHTTPHCHTLNPILITDKSSPSWATAGAGKALF